jgi:hypothetical protein
MIAKSPITPPIWVENFNTNTTFIAPYKICQIEWQIEWMIQMSTRPHYNVEKIETPLTK